MAQRVPFIVAELGGTPIRSCAPVCRLRREGTGAHFRAHEGGARGQKSHGGKLGNPTNIREAGDLGRAALVAATLSMPKAFCRCCARCGGEGAITIGAIMRSLNARKVPTPRASHW